MALSVAVLWLSGGILNPLISKVLPTSLVKPGTFLLALVIAICHLIKDHSLTRSLVATLVRDKWFCSILALGLTVAFLSVTWSSAPSDTLQLALTLAGTILIGLYIGSRYTIGEYITLLLWTLAPLLVLSLFVCLVFPQVGIMTVPDFDPLHSGRWMGVFSHKNWLGLYSGLVAVLLATQLAIRPVSVVLFTGAILLLVVTMTLLIKAESTTALVAFGFSVLVLLIIRITKSGISGASSKVIRNIFMFIACPLLLGFMISGSNVLSSISLSVHESFQIDPGSEPAEFTGITDYYNTHGFGRTLSISGRAPHWKLIVEKILEKPFTGYGYEAFWRSSDADSVHSTNQWIAQQAHSGWLDLALDFGVPVAMFLIIAMILLLRRYIYLWLDKRNDQFAAAFFVTLYLYIENTTESVLPNNSGLVFIIFLSLATIASKVNHQKILQRKDSASS